MGVLIFNPLKAFSQIAELAIVFIFAMTFLFAIPGNSIEKLFANISLRERRDSITEAWQLRHLECARSHTSQSVLEMRKAWRRLKLFKNVYSRRRAKRLC
jgi:hypothetical protein